MDPNHHVSIDMLPYMTADEYIRLLDTIPGVSIIEDEQQYAKFRPGVQLLINFDYVSSHPLPFRTMSSLDKTRIVLKVIETIHNFHPSEPISSDYVTLCSILIQACESYRDHSVIDRWVNAFINPITDEDHPMTYATQRAYIRYSLHEALEYLYDIEREFIQSGSDSDGESDDEDAY